MMGLKLYFGAILAKRLSFIKSTIPLFGWYMRKRDKVYFELRAEQELLLAQLASDPCAVRSHYQLAGLYLHKLSGRPITGVAATYKQFFTAQSDSDDGVRTLITRRPRDKKLRLMMREATRQPAVS